MKYYDKLIFELSRPGRSAYSLPEAGDFKPAGSGVWRETPLDLPEVSESDVVRHYTNLSQMNFGVDTGLVYHEVQSQDQRRGGVAFQRHPSSAASEQYPGREGGL